MFEGIKRFLSGSGKHKLPPLRPGFYVDYVSGHTLGADYYELRAFLDCVLIAESHGYILPTEEFRVTKIQVYTDYRGKGYGRQICMRLIEEAKNANCQNFVFEAVDHANLAAISLYRSLGANPVESKINLSRKDFSLGIFPGGEFSSNSRDTLNHTQVFTPSLD